MDDLKRVLKITKQLANGLWSAFLECGHRAKVRFPYTRAIECLKCRKQPNA